MHCNFCFCNLHTADLASSDLFVRNLLVTLTAACSESVHVHKAHLKDSFLLSHPSVLLSRLVWFCPQSWRLFTQREAEMWQTIRLYYTVSVSSSRIFSVALAWTDFLVWHWSPGISPSFPEFLSPSAPWHGFYGRTTVACFFPSRAQHATWQHHIAVAYVLHGTSDSSDDKAWPMGHLYMSVTKIVFF